MKKLILMASAVSLATGVSACGNASDPKDTAKVLSTFDPFCGPPEDKGYRHCLAMVKVRYHGSDEGTLLIIGMSNDGWLDTSNGKALMPDHNREFVEIEAISGGTLTRQYLGLTD